MSIERLTAEDRVMLWPDEVWPQDIGALAVLDGGNLLDPDGRFRIEAVREAVAGRLHLVPRFRQLLYVPPARLGGPLWVDDPSFDLSHHVGILQLAAPGDETQLLLATEQLRRRRLDGSRPLWEMWFLTGMPDRRVGMFVRAHHAIADGIAGVATLASFLDAAPGTEALPAEPWAPAPAPAEADLLADDIQRRRDARRRMLSKLAHPLASLRNVATEWPALHELFAEPSLPPTSLDRLVGPDRTIALVRSNLEEVKAIAHNYDAKVNDVFLTLIAGGLRTLLSSRREPIEGVVLRIYVPVSLRHGQYAGARGNQVAQMVVPLPIGVSDPVQRLQQITARTGPRKARTRPSVGGLPTRGFAGRVMLKLIERQRVNVESADLPGPPMPLYLAGARVLEVFPLLPLIGRVSLGIGALSYAGQLNIGAVGDREAYPDIGIFAAGLRDDLHSLEVNLHSPAAA